MGETRPLCDVLRELASEPPPRTQREGHASRALPLGDFLVAEGILAAEDLSVAAATQVRTRRPLDSILVGLGFISERELARGLAAKFHLPFLDLRICELDSSAPWARLVAPTDADVLPVALDDSTVTVAVADPLEVNAVDEIRLRTKRDVRLVVAAASDIRRARKMSAGAPVLNERESESVDDTIASLAEWTSIPDAELAHSAVLDDDSAGGFIKLARQIIIDAHAAGASDIHIEPNRDQGPGLIRFRVDGDCELYRRIPSVLVGPLVARMKILAGMDIAERRRPLDGKIQFRVSASTSIELRVATIPTAGGNEDVVLRILPPSVPRPIAELGLSDRDLRELEQLLAMPYGLLLCVGPTGSGKTTTLHSMLGSRNSPDVKIWTAEDPVEITQPGLRQVQINRRIGLDFATAMRAFLRGDPDIIMIGEMRDAETASTAVTASLTGHLVLSSLHTNNAPETIVRLLDMGLDPFGFSDALLGIVAQRLVRALCATCRAPGRASDEEVAALVDAYGGAATLEKNLARSVADGFTVWRAVGCGECRMTGYKGRIAICELLVVNEALRRAIVTRASAADIRALAIAGGMRTLLQNAVAKVLVGATDMAQALTVSRR